MNKIYAIFLLPLIPVLILIDILVVDNIIGVKTPIKVKIKEHKTAFVNLWWNK